jgi:hypothetical protein
VIVNNTVDSTQQGIEEILATTGDTISNDLCNNPTAEAGTAACIVLSASTDVTAANHNILPGTNVALVGGVGKTFAQWQAFGFDAAGYNASATFLQPFYLAPGSLGIGTADTSFGNGPQIGANQLLLPNLSPLTPLSATGQ